MPSAARRQPLDGYASGAITKLQYASYLTGALAYLMHRQRDSFGLIEFDESIAALLPASARAGHLRAVLLALERLKLGTRTNVAKPLRDLAAAVRKRGMVVLVSDLLDDPPTFWKASRIPLSRHRGDRVSHPRSV